MIWDYMIHGDFEKRLPGITNFFQIDIQSTLSNNGTTEQINIWDSFKAYIRGIMIQQKNRTNYKTLNVKKKIIY